ncbi:MAG: SDR family NAD(P)-dependent oxidoreductase [Bacteroidales bacterium]|nr:SDR family NAD(P)-dependent oxidoreductase [Bacteroidales bacterium]
MTALITGGGSGIGLEYARQLAGRGYDLALVSNREDELKAAKEELSRAYSIHVATLTIDLAQHGAAHAVLDWCGAEGIEPEVLVNNAGMFFMEYLGAENLKKVSAMMALHVETVTELCVLFGSRMKERGKGYILNMASVTAWIPSPGIAVYSASKAYLVSFGKGLSYELHPFGINVTTVCPAAIDTGLYMLSDKQRKTLRRLGIMKSPEWLVKRALIGMFRGRRVMRPGPLNRLLPTIISCLPASLIDRLGLKWIYKPKTI